LKLTSAQINISWFCDFHSNSSTSCEYCWVTMAQSDRSRDLDHPPEEWLEAIVGNLPDSALIDFVGGEPTIFPKFHWLLTELSNTHRWSITSNMGANRWQKYCEEPVPNCRSWTASYHPSSRDTLEEFAAKCIIVSRHYPLQVNLVDYHTYDAPAALEQFCDAGLNAVLSPFEDVRDLNVPGTVPLTCNGGQSHVLIDPEGHVYKCLTQERRADRARWRFGNIFEYNIEWPTVRNVCFIPCDQYYNLDRHHSTRDMWELDVRELEVPSGVDLSLYRGSFDVPSSPLKAFIQDSKWLGNEASQARGDLLDQSSDSRLPSSDLCQDGARTSAEISSGEVRTTRETDHV
jgi:hypothetical protein